MPIMPWAIDSKKKEPLCCGLPACSQCGHLDWDLEKRDALGEERTPILLLRVFSGRYVEAHATHTPSVAQDGN